jgi:hypothetical protein
VFWGKLYVWIVTLASVMTLTIEKVGTISVSGAARAGPGAPAARSSAIRIREVSILFIESLLAMQDGREVELSTEIAKSLLIYTILCKIARILPKLKKFPE